MWSLPPAEPPAHDTARGPALTRSIRSFIDLIGDFVGTTTMLYSPVRRASGVTSASVTFERLVANDATMPKPPTIMASLRPDLVADELREADRAAGAADIDDGDAFAEPLLLDGRLQRARGAIVAAAGRGRRHDLNIVERQRRRLAASKGARSERARTKQACGSIRRVSSFPPVATSFAGPFRFELFQRLQPHQIVEFAERHHQIRALGRLSAVIVGANASSAFIMPRSAALVSIRA